MTSQEQDRLDRLDRLEHVVSTLLLFFEDHLRAHGDTGRAIRVIESLREKLYPARRGNG